MTKTRQTFPPEFQVEALQLMTGQYKSLAEVAPDLDLGEGLLRAEK